MNLQAWKKYFEENARHRVEPDWSRPCTLERQEQAILASSLACFQLGESGGGNHLFQKAEGRVSKQHVELLQMFIREENEHARQLARLVERFGGTLIRKHWSHGCFSFIRQALDFDWEIQTLLCVELLGSAYYYFLGLQSRDPVLREACRLMVQDEIQHLAFHLEYFQQHQKRRTFWRKTLWRWQFKAMLRIICAAAWLDHGRCMRHFGANWTTFMNKVELLGAPWLEPNIDLRLWYLCVRPAFSPASPYPPVGIAS
jgi:demethoxyubiquinone hydroxylase (CLK1/Coq7/Cat5 family)